MFREIATIVADKCVNPRTRLPYPVSLIEKSMSDLHFSVNTTKSAKQQALELIKQLEKQQDFPISRAQMRLSVESPVSGAEIRELLAPMLATEPEIDASVSLPAIKMAVLIDPGRFRQVHETVARASRSKGTVLTLSLKDSSKADQYGQNQI
jgi:ribosome maturation protein SDO1